MRLLPLSVCILAFAPAWAAVPAKSCASLSAPADGGEFTAPLQAAIDACAVRGGGQVRLTAGRYPIAPIRLGSGVDLHLDKGAVLLGTPDHGRYQMAYINWAFRPGEALISAADVHDVSITGEGTIDGQGESWWADVRAKRWKDDPKIVAAGIPASNGMPRPWLIETYRARNVVIAGVRIRRAPMWNIVLRYTDHARIEGVDIENPANSPNTDGIDLAAARDVSIAHATISTGDDDIAIKSGLAGSALDAVPTENIRIHDLKIGRGHGLSIGSETIFGIRNVAVRNVSFDGTDNGIRIKTARDRGNRLNGFTFENIVMHRVGTAVSVSDYYAHMAGEDDPAQAVTATTPYIEDVVIRNLKADGVRQAGQFIGLPEAPLRRIRLERVRIAAEQPVRVRHAALFVRDFAVTGTKPLVCERGASVSGAACQASSGD